MKTKGILANTRIPVFANTNDNSAFIPEVWAQEALIVLESELLMANLVYRDFENEIAKEGDTVNTRRPGTFEAKRKIDGDAVTNQAATSENVDVKLNQHLHTSFIIYDGEESVSFQSLIDFYLKPAVRSLALGIDSVIMGETYNFMGENSVGAMGTAVTQSTMIAMRKVMNDNKVPGVGRNVVTTTGAEADILEIDNLITADKVGDEGTALREGNIGRKYGLNFFMSQNTPSIGVGNTTVAAAVNNANDYAAGSTSIIIDSSSETLIAGSWCSIAGDDTPQKITAVSGTPTTTITISPGLRSAVLNDAVVTVYSPGAVNLGAGYAAGYGKELVINGFTVAPQRQQLVSFNAAAPALLTAPVYGAFNTPTTTGAFLNRPLDVALTNADVMGIGPAGDYSFGFHRNAIALVTRPLAAVKPGTGAFSFTASYNGLSIRVTIAYDMTYQGHRVTVDLLCGVKTLDLDLGCVMFS